MHSIRLFLLITLLLTASVVAQKPRPTPTLVPRPAPKAETFTQKLLRIFGITAMPNKMKGDEADLRGDIWLADLKRGAIRRLTYDGGYRASLIAPDGQTVWALKGETIYALPVAGGAAKELLAVPGLVKLAGVNVANSQQLILLRQDGQRRYVVELLSLTDRQRTALPVDPTAADDARMLGYLREWQRSYDGGKSRLFTQAREPGAGRDVFLEESGGEYAGGDCFEWQG